MPKKTDIESAGVDPIEDTDGKPDFTEGEQYMPKDDMDEASGAENVDQTGPGAPKKKFRDTWLGRTLAGSTLTGKIAGIAKNILSNYVPAGPLLDRVTDRVGDSLKTQTETDHSALKNEGATMLKSKDPKTTLLGIVLIIAGAAQFFGIDSLHWDFATIATTLAPILSGAGLLVARDNKRSHESS